MYRVLELNPQLQPFAGDIELRMYNYRSTKERLMPQGGTLNEFANAHEYFGIHHVKGGWVYREWAPSAHQLYLEGEFNNWNQTEFPLTKLENGVWEIFLKGDKALWDGCKVKTVVDANMTRTEHIPLYARRVVQDKETITWCCEVVDDQKVFKWTDEDFKPADSVYIYEAHVGMAQEEGKVGTYREFAKYTLPRIKKAGYNTVQLMAIMEHPYYGSFGYQVSSFFAASSWFGKPEDLKYMVNKAHKLGIRVLLDVVHSHAVKNTAEGINMFDGTEWQFFHDGPKGDHPAWGTKCFNYGKREVIHFLLSNLKFWMTEYHFDGFRFDGITSMLYHDHGLGTDFNSNDKYFSMNTHTEAITYLQLANELIREVNPNALTIAEDMSGMPGMCLPIEDGGMGFNYRLAMGLPDMWIRTVKEKSDADWLAFVVPFAEKAHDLSTKDTAWVEQCLLLYKEQLQYGAEIGELISMYFNEPVIGPEAQEVLDWDTTKQVAESFLNNLPTDWSVESLKEAFNTTKKETELKGKPLFMGLRVAGTHQVHGPDLMSALYLMGHDVVEARLKDYVA